jgi:hypothetical protein
VLLTPFLGVREISPTDLRIALTAGSVTTVTAHVATWAIPVPPSS